MVNENIIGRMKCPCCGEEMQDVKVNKNGNLYMICDNSCRVNFSPKQTRKFKPVLLAGHNVSENGLFITSLKGVNNGTRAETPVRTSTNTGTITGSKPDNGTTRNTVVRRSDGKPAAAGNAGDGAAAFDVPAAGRAGEKRSSLPLFGQRGALPEKIRKNAVLSADNGS